MRGTAGDIRGDINDYVSYAWNLEHAWRIFVVVAAAAHETLPDSYRGPGYPVFLATIMRLSAFPIGSARRGSRSPRSSSQCRRLDSFRLSRAGVAGRADRRLWHGACAVLAEPRAVALAGILIALWPHLDRVLRHAAERNLVRIPARRCLVVACCFIARSADRRSLRAAGVSALAYLVNPVVGAFPVLSRVLFVFAGNTRRAMFLVAIVLPLAPVRMVVAKPLDGL